MQNNTLLVVAFGVLFASPVARIASELELPQGTWETRFQEQGRSLRVGKIIEKNRETVETYNGSVSSCCSCLAFWIA